MEIRIVEAVAGFSLAVASSLGGTALLQEATVTDVAVAYAPQPPIGFKSRSSERQVLIPDVTGILLDPEPVVRIPRRVGYMPAAVNGRREAGNADREDRASYNRFLAMQRRADRRRGK